MVSSEKRLHRQWCGSFQLSIRAVLVDFASAAAPFAFELNKLSSSSSINSMASTVCPADELNVSKLKHAASRGEI